MRSFFDQKSQSSQAMWMDMALARQSGQELVNHYVITNSPASAPIRRFFHASIKHLTDRYQQVAAEQALQDIKSPTGDQLFHDSLAVDNIKEECDPPVNEASGYTVPASEWPHHAGCRHVCCHGSPRLWVYHAGCQVWTCR